MTYSEVCTILSFEKNFQVLNLMNIQNSKLNLTYYSHKKFDYNKIIISTFNDIVPNQNLFNPFPHEKAQRF
jgi:hypothetical protein